MISPPTLVGTNNELHPMNESEDRGSRGGAGIAEGLDGITGAVIDASIKIHRELGPGLLESVYEAVLARDLARRGLVVERQKTVAFDYDHSGRWLGSLPQAARRATCAGANTRAIAPWSKGKTIERRGRREID